MTCSALENIVDTLDDNALTYHLEPEEKESLAKSIITNLGIPKGERFPKWE